jgi:hypothetical protein
MQDTNQHGKIKTFHQASASFVSLNFASGKESKYLVSMDEDTWDTIIKI